MTPIINQVFGRSESHSNGLLFCYVASGLLMLSGCFGDVAHDNPFDPNSDSYTPAGSVVGLVQDRTSQPVADVEMRLQGAGETTSYRVMTDQFGAYQFQQVPPGVYTMIAGKEGFAQTVDSISVVEFQSFNNDIVLNGAPLFEQVTIRSAHIHRVWPPPLEFTLLEVNAVVSDLDGVIDIEKTWFEMPGLSISDTLLFTETPGLFRKDLGIEQLGLTSMQDLLGEDIVVKARDRLGFISTMTATTIARIITDTPVVVSPQAGSVLSESQPVLSWVCQEIPFSFRYRVEVVRVDDVVKNSVTVISDLNPASICMDQEGSSQQQGSVQVDLSLNIGSYFWTVSIVDDFGNWSRSKEAGFVIN